MANYVKQTWTDGSGSTPLSAARMGVMENGIFDAHFQPTARVFHNAAQSITTSVVTTLAFNSERFDTDTIHDTLTNNSRLTCKTAGKYAITGMVEWAGNTSGTRVLIVLLNGITTIARVDQVAGVGGPGGQQLSTLWDMAVNDYVELQVFQSSGGALNVNASGNYSPEFMMSRVA